ncbi:MAG TPA: TonB-dependent receptor [Vicinamibacterales bacterium]|nr:TonB-dependent receptor [Vicinamibacterales bacterium]
MKVLSAALVLVCGLFVWSIPDTSAQGVTTASITGVVRDAQGGLVPGATVVAVHQPSGTSYEGVSQGDGRFFIPGMRVGGPYKVTASLSGFRDESKDNITLSLGVAQDVDFAMQVAAVAETVQVVAVADPVFASSRTGAATAISRDDIAELPTINGRLSDLTRLTPQASSNSSFAGQDGRVNNMTVDGAYFNSSFGLGEGQAGGRTLVAPISLESIEQVQVSIAPYDVREGNFIGASVNTVTRSGTNQLTASVYQRMRNDGWVGTEASGLPVNPGTFTFRNTGVWGGGPVVRNKLFVFGNYENELFKAPLHTFVANSGGQAATGSVTRVLASDLDALSAFLDKNFSYKTGGYQNLPAETPGKRYLLRSDFNLNNSNKISFRYSQLDSSSGKNLSSSTSAGLGRGTFSTAFLNFAASNYSQLENIKSSIGEWNAVLGQRTSNNFVAGYTKNDESRGDWGKLFPFVDILGPDGTAYTSFGTEPFTPNNELRYNTYQAKDDITYFANQHSITVGGTLQRYAQENVFFSLQQSGYVYNSLQDFYTDANDFLANPNRTTSPVTLRRFQVRYMNIPGLSTPLQPLRVWSSGGYAQDEYRIRQDMTITAGARFDRAQFANTTFPNPAVDALTFRDETGAAVKYSSGQLPDPKFLWSPRAAMNWDVGGKQTTQVRVGTGVFTGPPPYVWVSNQIGQTGVLTGFDQIDNTTTRPFNPNPDAYKPKNVTGASAASFEFNVSDPSFKFPQVWRTNLAVDRRLFWGITSTTEYLYNKTINGIYYINANLPAAQTAFTGVDNRPRWTANRINTGTPTITAAYVMKNESMGRSWNISEMLSKPLYRGLTLKGAYSYGMSRNTIDPGSNASGTWLGHEVPFDPNNPGLGIDNAAQGHRVFVQASYNRQYFGFGATTISAFFEAKPSYPNFSTTASYVFAGDMNGDGAAGNDLIYIPRSTSEMNFTPFTLGSRTFTAEEQAQAFETYINQDKYLSAHRGEYATRGGVFYPMMKRMDLSLVQDVFTSVAGRKHSGQFRLDITNFSNLLNHNWGVSQRLVVPVTAANGAQILTNPGVDAQGRATYRMQVANGQLVTKSFQTNTLIGQNQTSGSDVYQLMISFRYSFN